MPAPLHEDAIALLHGQGAPITADNLNQAMAFLVKQPDMRPSYQSPGGGMPQDMNNIVNNMGGADAGGWNIQDGAPGPLGTVPSNGLDPRDPRNGHPGVDTTGMSDGQISDLPYDQLATDALPQNVLRPNRSVAPRYDSSSIPVGKLSGINATPGAKPLPAQPSDTSYLNRPQPTSKPIQPTKTTTEKHADGTVRTTKAPLNSTHRGPTGPAQLSKMLSGEGEHPPTVANPQGMPTSAVNGPNMGGAPGSGAGSTADAGTQYSPVNEDDQGGLGLGGMAATGGIVGLLAHLLGGRYAKGVSGTVIPPGAGPMAGAAGAIGRTIDGTVARDVAPSAGGRAGANAGVLAAPVNDMSIYH
jgi:hypothetical protein